MQQSVSRGRKQKEYVMLYRAKRKGLYFRGMTPQTHKDCEIRGFGR